MAVVGANTGNFGLVDVDAEQRNREITQEYIDFFDDSKGDNQVYKQIEDFVAGEISRVIINVDFLRSRMPDRADGVTKNFVDEVVCIQAALKELYKRTSDDAYDGQFHVGFEGSFGERHVNPRSLKSTFLGSLVCCEGIVTKCSTVKPKVVTSVHYCPATKKTLERAYTDMTDYVTNFSTNHYPSEDENKNPLVSEFGLSTYKDHQSFSLQELPECAPAGQLPRSVDIIADWDLADVVQPGDRVRVIGLYRVLPRKHQGYTDCSFRSILIANNIQLMSKLASPDLESEDIKRIRKMAKEKDIFEMMARSLAPSIYGHEEVKKGILSLLLGGDEKITESGVRIRGDINVLLIGDPSVAKSQLLSGVMGSDLVVVVLALAVCHLTAAQEHFVFMHPANPRYFSDAFIQKMFPQQKMFVPNMNMMRMGMKDAPNTGLVRLKPSKPLKLTDEDVAKPNFAALDAATVVKSDSAMPLKSLSSSESALFLDGTKKLVKKTSKMRLASDEYLKMHQASDEDLIQASLRMEHIPKKETIKSPYEKALKFTDKVNVAPLPMDENNFSDAFEPKSTPIEKSTKSMWKKTRSSQSESRENSMARVESRMGRRLHSGSRRRVPASGMSAELPLGVRNPNAKLVSLSGSARIAKSRRSRMRMRSSSSRSAESVRFDGADHIMEAVRAKPNKNFYKLVQSSASLSKGSSFDPWAKGMRFFGKY